MFRARTQMHSSHTFAHLYSCPIVPQPPTPSLSPTYLDTSHLGQRLMQSRKLPQYLPREIPRALSWLGRHVHETVVLRSLLVEAKGGWSHHQDLIGGLPYSLFCGLVMK